MATLFNGENVGITYNENSAFSKVRLKFVNLQSSIVRYKAKIKIAKTFENTEEQISECRRMLKVRRLQLAYVAELYKFMLQREFEKIDLVA